MTPYAGERRRQELLEQTSMLNTPEQQRRALPAVPPIVAADPASSHPAQAEVTMMATIMILPAAVSAWLWWRLILARGENAELRAEPAKLHRRLHARGQTAARANAAGSRPVAPRRPQRRNS